MQKENHGFYDVNKGPLAIFWGTSDQHFAPEYLVRFNFFDVHMFAFVTAEFETWISWGEFKA